MKLIGPDAQPTQAELAVLIRNYSLCFVSGWVNQLNRSSGNRKTGGFGHRSFQGAGDWGLVSGQGRIDEKANKNNACGSGQPEFQLGR